MAVGATRFYDLRFRGKNILLITMSISCLVWSFYVFFHMTSHLPDFVVEYVGSSPLTEVIANTRSFRPAFMVSGATLRIGTIPVWARKRFC